MRTERHTVVAGLLGASLFLGALQACQCQPELATCAAASCPCIVQADCPANFDCIDDVCVLHRDLPDAAVEDAAALKGFGELCEHNAECESGFCVADTRGAFCTVRCQAGCPVGWVCRLVPDPRGEPEPVGLCLYDRALLCQPCVDDVSCDPAGGDRCLADGALQSCGRDCTFEDCPGGYRCIDTEGPTVGRQCWPESETCACTVASEGLTRSCVASNDVGTCAGQELCEAGAWSACSARTPALEDCNGLDDDCNVRVDEGQFDRACERSAGGWTCAGTERCGGSNGWQCDAPEPVPELCDGLDNNCNAAVDEDFVDLQGRYITPEHCGGCGVVCQDIVPHAVATDCRVVEDRARCVATSCESGFFVYDAGVGATLCMALPDNLCDACAVDGDCLAPGSRCLETEDGRFCGRDCAAGSVYGTSCPLGYACVTEATGAQCRPGTQSCLCNVDRVGTIRACTVDVCTGYETCGDQGAGPAWSSCDISSAQEICDALDNDCDDEIDEGFLNPVSGRYDADQHCGFCNNDCTAIWAPEIHHAEGDCDASGAAMPSCRLSCLDETVDGVLYQWVDVNADPMDGCECRRVAGNLDQDVPDRGAFPQPWADYVDENCDGVDGVIAHSLFVSALGSATGTGSLANPFATLGAALAALPASGKRYLLVAEGVYPEDLELRDGDKLFGGYASDFLSRDVLLHSTVIQGVAPVDVDAPATINASDLGRSAAETIVSGFTIQGRDIEGATADNAHGAASVAVYLSEVGPGLVLQNNVIRGGRGGPGGRGSTGAVGYGRQNSTALDGTDGLAQVRQNGVCPVGLWREGGAGGANLRCPASNAHRGGGVRCPTFDWASTPYQGAHAEYATPTGNDGEGGFDWSFDPWSNQDGRYCGHVTESGWPDPQRNVGNDGRDGADGAPGTGGLGGRGRYGSVSNGVWVRAPAGATVGSAGTAAAAGGGGGAGGGTARWYTGADTCPEHEQGATGGGGGAGGCGGAGGSAGGAGGASIAVLIVRSSVSSSVGLPSLVDNRIERGAGGDGGTGGYGGPGGQGGRGGFGGPPSTWVGSTGGKGGDGGNGGPGAGGGGGSGGASYGVLGFNTPGATFGEDNTYLVDDSVETGGAGGVGGGAAASSALGGAGLPGASGNVVLLSACGAGGSCPVGSSCDANSVCVPGP
ncbi:MAG: MopE-related protein [Pseudomonadota bacterium]